MFYFVDSGAYMVGVFLAIAIACFVYCGVLASSNGLIKKFQKLGNMSGKSLKEIEAAVGPAKDYQRLIAQNTGNWVKNVTWRKGKYEIIIMFDSNDIFDHIVSETKY